MFKTLPTGDIYKGDIMKGLPDGYGEITYQNGQRYVGQFSNGRATQPGQVYDINGSLLQGDHTVSYLNNKVHTGHYLNGQRDGFGKSIYESGDVVEGIFLNDLLNGQGTELFSNGDKYVGQFMNGKRHGTGTETCKNGNVYVGEWKDGKKTGRGEFSFIQNEQGSHSTPLRSKTDILTETLSESRKQSVISIEKLDRDQ